MVPERREKEPTLQGGCVWEQGEITLESKKDRLFLAPWSQPTFRTGWEVPVDGGALSYRDVNALRLIL